TPCTRPARRKRTAWRRSLSMGLPLLRLPAVAAQERHEGDLLALAPAELAALRLPVEHQALGVEAPLGNQQRTTPRGLVEERLRRLRRSGGHQDAVEGGDLAPPHGAVEDLDLDVIEAQLAHARDRRLGELRHPLEAVDPPREEAQDRRLVAAPGADL